MLNGLLILLCLRGIWTGIAFWESNPPKSIDVKPKRYSPQTAAQFGERPKMLKCGIDMSFKIDEFDYQLMQLGHILQEKFVAMNNCFRWMRNCVIHYGFAMICAIYDCLTTIIHAKP